MSEVKRYSDLQVWETLHFTGSTNGWIRWEDYAALLAASQWQPIETAPKDGTAIQIRVIMRWDKDAQGWGYFQDPKTTAKWMPLPKPPAV